MFETKVTIFVPTLNRHAFLKRVVDYYSSAGLKVLATDDSKKPFPDAESYPNLKYCQTGLPFALSMVKPGIEHLDTEYTVLCADDILIPPAAIRECVEFLDANPDYAAAQGYQASLYASPEGDYFKIEEMVAPDYASDSPSDRVLKFFSSQHRLYWGVWRTSAWKEVYSNIAPEILTEPTSLNLESMIYFATPMVGKLKRLPIFFSLHEDVRSVSVALKRRKGFSHWDVVTKDEYREVFERLIDQAVELLLKYEPLSEAEARMYARKAFEINGLWHRDSVGRKTFLDRLKREGRSLWRKTFGRKAYLAQRHSQSAERAALDAKRFAAMRQACKDEMLKAAKFIRDYPSCRANGS